MSPAERKRAGPAALVALNLGMKLRLTADETALLIELAIRKALG